MSLNSQKRNLLLLLGGGLLALTILAASLPGMEMSMGTAFGTEGFGFPNLGVVFDDGQVELDPRIVQILGLIAVVGIPLSLVLFLVSPEMRKRVFRDAIALALFVGMMFIVFQRNPELEGLMPTVDEPGQTFSQPGNVIAPDDLITSPPAWVPWAFGFVVIGVGGGILWMMSQRAYVPDRTLADDLREETQSAVDSLQSGENIKEVVERCYIRMHHVLAERHRLSDSQTLTPREFEQRMMNVTGLPRDEITRLTALFERVRYGDKQASEQEKDEAIACLNTIREAL